MTDTKDKLLEMIQAADSTVKEIAEEMGMNWSTLRNKLSDFRPWAYTEVVEFTDEVNSAGAHLEDPPDFIDYEEVIEAIGADRIFLPGTLKDLLASGIDIDGIEV